MGKQVINKNHFQITDMATFFDLIIELLSGSKSKTEKDPVICQFSHLWWNFSGSTEQKKKLTKVLNSKRASLVICKGDTAADRLLKKLYNEFNIKVVLGEHAADFCNVVVAGDYVYQFFIPDTLEEHFDAIYSTFRGNSPISLMTTIDSSWKKTKKIEAVVLENPCVAQMIIKQKLNEYRYSP